MLGWRSRPSLVISNASPIGSDDADGRDVRATADDRHRAGRLGAAAILPAEIPDDRRRDHPAAVDEPGRGRQHRHGPSATRPHRRVRRRRRDRRRRIRVVEPLETTRLVNCARRRT